MQLVVNIDVDDLEQAIHFYMAALGLRLGRRMFDPFGHGFCLIQFQGNGYDEVKHP